MEIKIVYFQQEISSLFGSWRLYVENVLLETWIIRIISIFSAHLNLKSFLGSQKISLEMEVSGASDFIIAAGC